MKSNSCASRPGYEYEWERVRLVLPFEGYPQGISTPNTSLEVRYSHHFYIRGVTVLGLQALFPLYLQLSLRSPPFLGTVALTNSNELFHPCPLSSPLTFPLPRLCYILRRHIPRYIPHLSRLSSSVVCPRLSSSVLVCSPVLVFSFVLVCLLPSFLVCPLLNFLVAPLCPSSVQC